MGASIFGVLAVTVAFRLANRLALREDLAPAPPEDAVPVLDAPVAPTSAAGGAAALAGDLRDPAAGP